MQPASLTNRLKQRNATDDVSTATPNGDLTRLCIIRGHFADGNIFVACISAQVHCMQHNTVWAQQARHQQATPVTKPLVSDTK